MTNVGNTHLCLSLLVKKIVRSSIRCHTRALAGGNGTDAAVIKVVDGEVQEDSASEHRPVDILDVFVSPSYWLAIECGDSLLRENARLGGVEKSSLPKCAFLVLERHGQDLPYFVQRTAIRWVSDKFVRQEPEEQGEEEVHNSREEVR